MEYGSAQKSQSLFSPGATNLAGALEIQFDIEVAPFDMMTSNSSLKIYNPPLFAMKNAFAYQGMEIEISAGFANYNGAGLPLADPTTSGVIGRGQVVLCYGNFQGTDMCLDIAFAPPLGAKGMQAISKDSKFKFNFNWDKSTDLSTALKTAFTPSGIKNINLNLTAPIDLQDKSVQIYANDIRSFALSFRQKTQALMLPTYQGNRLIGGLGIHQVDKETIDVVDYRRSDAVQVIHPQEIIGQPTVAFTNDMWAVQSVHPLRADILLTGKNIQLKVDNNRFVVTPSQIYSAKELLFDSQSLLIQKIRHSGKFRDSSQSGWITTIESGWLPQQDNKNVTG